MATRFECVAAALGFVFLITAPGTAGESKPAADEAVFELREVSVLDWAPSHRGIPFTRGQNADLSREPDKAVKAYPKLKSKTPLYGKVKFDWYPGQREGIEYRFVLDESGEAPPTETDKPEAKPAEEKSLLKSLGQTLLGSKAAPVPPPELPPKRSSYDRLYFDLNRDLDLSNDPPVAAMKDPKWQALPPWSAVEKQMFDCLAVEFDFGPGLGKRPFRVLPWLRSSGKDKDITLFFASAVVREGRIALGKREYDAVLAQAYLVTGRFDRSSTNIQLTPVQSGDELEYITFEGDMLHTLRRVDGQLYVLSTTPLGDRLVVKPYRGDLGVLELGPGKRDLKEMSFSGALRAEDWAVGIGAGPGLLGAFAKTRRATVPVGDYLPGYVSIEYGPLRISISDNYHSDGKPRDMERKRTYGIRVRKDKPFVLDFSNQPAVLFASPAKGLTVKPGDEVRVAAVLVDPTLDVMIRGLDDTRSKHKVTFKLADGKEHSYERSQSLDPVVTVTDSAGKTVSEGKMPFG
ncbi:MAG: hypothetical protein NUV77_23390 [Thermoguttaceae bacterium]|jgi:hypothetical protein|nr:hypothetical protein [Thermoguttaceae bacterium]